MLAGLMALVLAVGGPGESSPVGVLPARLEGDFTAAQRRTIEATVTERLAEDARVVPPEILAESTAGTEACTEPACWKAGAEAAEVAYLVDVHVARSGPDYDLRLRLVDGRTGQSVASAERRCEICGFTEMIQTLGELASTVGRRVDEPAVAAALRVTTVPDRARVWVDGSLVGTTPLEVTVIPGTRAVRIERIGYIAREQPMSLVAGTTAHLDVQLEPRPRSGLRIAGWLTLGTGVVAVAGGVPLLALHGRQARIRCSGPDVDADGDCRYRYGTLAGGAVAVAAGGVLLATATTLLALGYHRPDERRVRAALGPRGLVVEGRF